LRPIKPFPTGTTISASHAWAFSGPKQVKVRAWDWHNNVSGWSAPLTVTILAQPPTTPSLAGSAARRPAKAGRYGTITSDLKRGTVKQKRGRA